MSQPSTQTAAPASSPVAQATLPSWQPLALKSQLSAQEAVVGQTLTWSIDVTRPAEVSVKLPTTLKLDPFTLNAVRHSLRELPKRSADDTASQTRSAPSAAASAAQAGAAGLAGAQVEHFELDVGVYTLENAALPDLSLEVATPSGSARLLVPGPAVVVKTKLEDAKAEAKALTGPVPVWVSDLRLLKWGGGVLGVLLLALLVWRLMRRWRKRRQQAPAVKSPPKPCDQQALEALEALSKEGLVRAGRRRIYFFRLSEIVRVYLGARFGIVALEATTEELLALLRDRPTPGLSFARFEHWCALGDQVKFARWAPSDAECSEALTEAVALIKESTAAASAPSVRTAVAEAASSSKGSAAPPTRSPPASGAAA